MNHADQTERPPPRLRNHVFVTMLENRGTKLGLLDLIGEEQRGQSLKETSRKKEKKNSYFSPYQFKNSVHWLGKKSGPHVDRIWYLKNRVLGSKNSDGL